MSDLVTAPQTYPYSESFCTKLLGLCLRDPGFLQRHLDVIHSGNFKSVYLSTLCKLMLDYFKKHYTVPTQESMGVMVYDFARDFGGSNPAETHAMLISWLEAVYSVDLSDSDFVDQKCVAFAQHQAFKSAIGKGIEMLERNDEDLSKFREVFDDALRVGSTRVCGTDFQTVALNLPQVLRDDPVYGSKNKVPTGFSVLDQRLNGGLGAGEVMVVAGPPARGKTTVLVHMARKAAYHFRLNNLRKTVIYFTLEGGMKESDICAKLAASMTGLPIAEIAANHAQYLPRIQEHNHYHLGPLAIRVVYFPPATKTVDDLRWFIVNMMSTEQIEPGLLLVDYADKLKDMKDDRYSDAGRIYDGLTAIGDKFKCGVATGSQVNRTAANDETIVGTGIAESWLKYANADIVITLNQTRQEHAAKILRVYLLKVRKGEDDGTIWTRFHGNMSLIEELSAAEVENVKQALK